MQFSVEEFTPERAKSVLETQNKKNRKIQDKTVRGYVHDMKNGKWLITGDPLKFDTSDYMIDGQHRLSAVVHSGVTVNFAVIRGLEPEAQDVIDTGRRRTAGNMLELRGITHAAKIAAAARIGVAFDKGLLPTSMSRLPDCTHQEVVEWTEKHHESVLPVLAPSNLIYRAMGGSSAGILYAFHRLHLVDATATLQLLTDLNELKTAGKGDPRAALMKRLQVIGKDPRIKSTPSSTMFAVFRAWNAIQKGHQISIIVDSPNGKEIPALVERKK